MVKGGRTAELDRSLVRTDLAGRDPVDVYETGVWDEFNENNQRLVELVGGGELWEQWLAQEPIEEGAQEINIEPKRVIEPLRELSYPKSVLDIGSEDWLPEKPTPPGRLRRIKRRLLN